MDIEKYSKIVPQYYTDEIPSLLTQLLINNKFDTILDCGCGDGSILYGLKKRGLLNSCQVNAIDLSKNRISLVKKISPKFIARVDSAETLATVNTNSVDLLITTQVIEHVDDRRMISSMKRVVKKGGIVYLSTVYKMWYGWYFYKNNIGWVLDPTHLREYTDDSQLIGILLKDFKVICSQKTIQWFPIADFIVKRIGLNLRNRDGFLWRLMRSTRIPIPGYYIWDLILTRR